jgi:3',5'-cyclic AMP phosphodiesterase CpdA
MQTQNRKSFFKTLGIIGAGAFLSNKLLAAHQSTSDIQFLQTQRAKRVLRVAHLTDIHVCPEKVAEQGMCAALNELDSLPDRPDFIINGGDAIMNAVSFSKDKVKKQWESFHRILKSESNLPVYHCIGNHDLFGWAIPGIDHVDGKKWAMDEYQLKSSYYSFIKAGWKFIVLDSIHARKSLPGYYGKIDDEQFEWLARELKSVPSNTPICVVSHIPILAVCTLFDGSKLSNNHWSVPDNCLHSDAVKLRDLFFKYNNVKVCLSGHIHLIDHVNYLGTDYYCNGAVSGGWWKGDHQQFAPAFTIINFYEDGTTNREVHYYKWQA